MSEFDDAVKLANRVLENPYIDPDGDISMLARQFLRSIENSYFIDFDTKIDPGKLVAVRVRLDQVTVVNMNEKLSINLCEHPLYKELTRYVKANQ